MSTTLPSKELDELRRRFKAGYTVEQQQSGHFLVLDPNGDKVMKANGTPLTLAGTPHGGRATKNAEAELRRAGVLDERKRPERKTLSEAEQRRRAGLRDLAQIRQQNRAKEAKVLHDRMEAATASIGGLKQPGNQSDLAYIAAMLARENGHPDMTPDLLSSSILRVTNAAWVEPRYQEVWVALAEKLEAADVVSTEYFALVRKARNIPEPETLAPAQLKLSSDEWPFEVRLIDLDLFFLDHGYQRPPYWPFIRKIAAGFDETLVGAIDASDRGGRYAIMDGQLRYEGMRLVGKKNCWACVYVGLDQKAEARFFLKKNKERKAIHTYYTFRAQLVAGEPVAVAVDRIVRKYGYRIWMTSAATKHDDRNISAIDACRFAYTRISEARKECLTPTLETLKEATFGREQGNSAGLIRGLGRFFQEYGEVDMELLQVVVAERGSRWLNGRAREEARGSGSAQTNAMMRVLRDEYNRHAPRGEKL